MQLFHGTSGKYLESILKHGLLPRRFSKHKGNFAHTVQSDRNRVYLSDSYAPYFAWGTNGKDDDNNPVVIAVDTDRFDNLIMADEDAIEQVDRAQNKIKILDTKDIWRRTNKFRRLAPDLEYSGSFTYEDSLATLGTCAVAGTIDPKAILGYIKFQKGSLWRVWDPTITLLNYAFMKDFYREATRVAWTGGEPKELSGASSFYADALKRIPDLIVERKVFDGRTATDDPAQLPTG
jgi:hypothetical protein